jgi:hypothetical protein
VSKDVPHHMQSVLVAVAAGEDDDADLHSLARELHPVILHHGVGE